MPGGVKRGQLMVQSAMAMWRGCCVLGVAYIGWRLSSGAARRLAAVTTGNRRHKQELLNIWDGIAVRRLTFSPCLRTVL